MFRPQKPTFLKPAELQITGTRPLVVRENPQPTVTVDSPKPEVTFDPLEWNTKLQEGKITFAEFIEKLNELNISYQVYPCANNKNKANIKYEYEDFPYVFNVDKSVINGLSTPPQAPSEEEIQKTINNVISAFAKGNMTYEEAKSELSKVGISISTPLSKDDNDATQSYFEFTYNGVEYCVACNTEAIQNSKDNKTVTIWSQEEIKQQNFTKEQLNKYFQGVAWKQGAEGALYYRAKSDWPEGINTPAQLKTYLSKPSIPTFKKEELAGLDDNAIKRYFTVNADGTYSLNEANVKADFPEKDYGKIDTPAKLKEAIAKKAEADKTNSVTGTGGAGNSPTKGDFNTVNELSNYLFGTLRSDADIKNLKFDKGFSYEQIAELVRNRHKEDFASITKDQLKQEFIGEYKKRAGSTSNTGGTSKPSVPTFKKEELAGLDDNAIKRYFTVNADGTYSLNEANVKADFPEKDYGKIDTPAKLKEAIAKKAEADKTNSVTGTGGTGSSAKGDFSNYNDMVNYLFNNAGLRVDSDIKKLNFSKVSFETISTILKDKHKNDFASVTKAQLKAEFLEEYNKKVGGANSTGETGGTTGTDDNTLNTYEALKQYVQSLKSSMTGEPYKTYFDKASTTVLSRHNTAKFQSVTKAQIEAEIKAECEALKKADDDKPAAEDPNTKIKDAASKLRNPIGDVGESIVAVCKEAIGYKNSFKVGYSLDANDNIQFTKGSDAEKVFNTILEKLKSRINRYTKDALDAIGGEAMLKKLLQSAWAEASSGITNNSAVNTGDFINKVMNNLDKILSKVSTNPEYLDYYTNNCYQDKKLTNGLPNINDSKINYGSPKKYDTGEMHLNDDASDKKFQETMNKLLENIYNKYPNIDKAYLKKIFYQAQENALKYNDMPLGTNKNKMSDLVNLVLYHFDKLFKADAKNTTFAARTEDTQPRAAKSAQNDTQNNDIKTGAQGIMNCVEDVAESIVAVCKEAIGYKNNIHTEFGMDKNGNIVFQEKDTQKVFDTILEKLTSRINRYASDALQKLGGETVLKQLLQAAWITTYNDFNSSQSNNTTNFINKVMSNLEKILKKLQTNPELMEVFTKRPSYADNSVTSGVKHYGTKTTYGNDEVIIYGGNITKYADGTIHISNTTDDNDYQTTMNALLQKLLSKYPSLDTKTITSVFRNAQQKALQALQGNVFDCPYGTGHNNGRVEDSSKNWGGRDSRKEDDSKIHMDQLVQMTLYYFDKLIYAELLK